MGSLILASDKGDWKWRRGFVPIAPGMGINSEIAGKKANFPVFPLKTIFGPHLLPRIRRERFDRIPRLESLASPS
jgi:hypothetical protein